MYAYKEQLTKILLVQGIQSSLSLGHQGLSSCQVSFTPCSQLTDILGNDSALVCLHLGCVILQCHICLLLTHLQKELGSIIPSGISCQRLFNHPTQLLTGLFQSPWQHAILPGAHHRK